MNTGRRKGYEKLPKELEGLSRETERAISSMALLGFSALHRTAGGTWRIKGIEGIKRMGTADAIRPFAQLSNGAVVPQADIMRGASILPWRHHMPKAVILRSRLNDIERTHFIVGASSDGMAFSGVPERPYNLAGNAAKRYFNALTGNPEEMRQMYARMYAGAAAVGGYITEGLQVAFAIDADPTVFGDLYTAWLNESGGVHGLSSHTARMIGAPIADGATGTSKTLAA